MSEPEIAAEAVERLAFEDENADRCMDCGSAALGWVATDEHWIAVMGTYDAGVLCPRCFTRRSHERGFPCRWDALQTDEGEPQKSPSYLSIRSRLRAEWEAEFKDGLEERMPDWLLADIRSQVIGEIRERLLSDEATKAGANAVAAAQREKRSAWSTACSVRSALLRAALDAAQGAGLPPPAFYDEDDDPRALEDAAIEAREESRGESQTERRIEGTALQENQDA